MVSTQNLLTSPLGPATTPGSAPITPQPTPAMTPGPTPITTPGQQAGLEQNALNDNKQNISNFMSALNGVGAGTNNNFMNAQQAPVNNFTNLINPNVAYANNGGQAPNTMSGGQNAGMQVPVAQQPMAQTFANPSAMQAQQPGFTASAQQVAPGQTLIAGNQNNPVNIGQAQQSTPQYTAATNIIANPNSVYKQDPNSTLVSDENMKDNISTANPSINDFLNKINAHNYTYKDPKHGVGQFTSPMAQELEKTELGKQAVINTPEGKMVNYARLGGVNLAAVSVVHQEQQKLQKQINALRDQLRKVKDKK